MLKVEARHNGTCKKRQAGGSKSVQDQEGYFVLQKVKLKKKKRRNQKHKKMGVWLIAQELRASAALAENLSSAPGSNGSNCQ